MTNLIQDDPTDVYKFYESVPEMEGLEIPEAWMGFLPLEMY